MGKEANNKIRDIIVLPNSKAQEPSSSTHVSQLTAGQWGLVNAETGLVVEPAAASWAASDIPPNFYIAYVGDGTLGESGEIYKMEVPANIKNLVALKKSDYAAGQSQIVTLTPDSAEIEQGNEYIVKIEFRGNSELYQRFGYNQASKVFHSNTKCEIATGASYANTVLADIYEAIAKDTDYFIDVQITSATSALEVDAYDASSQKGVLTSDQESQLAALRAGAYTDEVLKITLNSLSSMYSFCNINPMYFKLLRVQGIFSFGNEDCTWGTYAETQALGYTEGLGYDIQQLEYEAGGWRGKPGPYRQSALHGLPKTGFEYLTTKTGTYNQYILEYEKVSTGGWGEYKNPILAHFVVLSSYSTNNIEDILDVIAAAGSLT